MHVLMIFYKNMNKVLKIILNIKNKLLKKYHIHILGNK